MPGVLYVVGTPIGNLGDVTLRAVETLKAVDRIVAEDTRRTRALLSHLGIRGKPVDCVQANTPLSRMHKVVEHLRDGESVALVTDAGMPGISDPGARLVSAAVEAGIGVQVVPGPSALTAALALSGLVEGPFYFLGFLPRQGRRRQAAIQRIVGAAEAVVLFESPQRIRATLRELAQFQPARAAVVCRELTKIHEQVRRGSLATLAEAPLEARGEIVLVLGTQDESTTSDDEAPPISDAALLERLNEGQSPRTILDDVGLTGQRRRELYARLLQLAER